LLLLCGTARSVGLFELRHSGEGLGGRDRRVPPKLGGLNSSHRERVPTVAWLPCVVPPLLPNPAMALLQIERHAGLWVVGIGWQTQ